MLSMLNFPKSIGIKHDISVWVHEIVVVRLCPLPQDEKYRNWEAF